MPESSRTRLVSLCKTRWVACHDPLSTFEELYKAVEVTLHSEPSQKTRMAHGRQNALPQRMVSKLEMKFFLFFFSVITKKALAHVKSLTEKLQKRTADICSAYSHQNQNSRSKLLLSRTRCRLCSAVIDPSVQPGSIGYMGINAMPRARVLSFSLIGWQAHCKSFVKPLSQETCPESMKQSSLQTMLGVSWSFHDMVDGCLISRNRLSSTIAEPSLYCFSMPSFRIWTPDFSPARPGADLHVRCAWCDLQFDYGPIYHCCLPVWPSWRRFSGSSRRRGGKMPTMDIAVETRGAAGCSQIISGCPGSPSDEAEHVPKPANCPALDCHPQLWLLNVNGTWVPCVDSRRSCKILTAKSALPALHSWCMCTTSTRWTSRSLDMFSARHPRRMDLVNIFAEEDWVSKSWVFALVHASFVPSFLPSSLFFYL